MSPKIRPVNQKQEKKSILFDNERNVSITTVVHFPDYSPDGVNLVVTKPLIMSFFSSNAKFKSDLDGIKKIIK